jgi:hypothetical protein
VSVECPTNIVRWSRSGQGVAVEFDVEGRSSCGKEITLTCVPPSGSVFPVGLTFVGCQAVDDFGYSARCRFPVAVYEGEPRVSIKRTRDGRIAVVLPAEFVPAEFKPAEFKPAEFHGWELEASDDLSARNWENLGHATEADEVSWRWLLPAVKTAQFFRLRAP